jgi:maltose O-acetyltransferase
VIVCPGVTVGDDSVVGAGAVLTRAVPAHSLAVGNPAREVRTI